MTTGRAMAQASHASNAFIHKYGHLKSVKKWQKETTQGFGTAIVLAATLDQIMDIHLNLRDIQPHELVVDPEYGIRVTQDIVPLLDTNKIYSEKTITNADGSAIVFVEEITCFYVFGAKDELDLFLGHLKLHP